MTETIEIPNVNMKDTKAKILEAYNKAVEKLSTIQSTTMNPKQKISEQNKIKTIAQAGDLSLLYSFMDEIKSAVDDYENLNDAIKYKKKEIKDLFDIEAECLSLAALIDSNEELKRKFDEESKEKLRELNEQLTLIRIKITEEQGKAQQERERKENEWKYNFERSRKKLQDELYDELDKTKKIHENKITESYDVLSKDRKELAERKLEIEKAENELNELREKVESMPEVIANEVRMKVGKERGILESRLEQEKKYFERDVSAKLEMAMSQVENLTSENEDLKRQIAGLTTKLENAYREIKDISIKTVEGAGNSQMFSEMKTLLKDRNNSK